MTLLYSLSLSSPVFFFMLFHVAFCLFVCFFLCCAALSSLCFFFSVECALHSSLVVRISSRGALQKEKVAIADLYLLLSFFFVCLFALLRWGKSSVTRVDGAESQLYVVSVRFFFCCWGHLSIFFLYIHIIQSGLPVHVVVRRRLHIRN